MRGATLFLIGVAGFRAFQSTLPVRGATDVSALVVDNGVISIHAPREGSDKILAEVLLLRNISIHAPREGSDRSASEIHLAIRDFNPRSP